MVGHVLLYQHSLRPGRIEVAAGEDFHLIHRGLFCGRHSHHSPQQLAVRDGQRNVGDDALLEGLDPFGGGGGGGKGSGVAAVHGEVGEAEVDCGLGVRRLEVLEGVVGGPEHRDPQEHGDGDRDEVGPAASHVPEQFAAQGLDRL